MRYVKTITVNPEDSEKIQKMLDGKEDPETEIMYAVSFPNDVEFSIQMKDKIEVNFYHHGKSIYRSRQKRKFFENWRVRYEGCVYVAVVC